MAYEIERKWLVDAASIPFDLASADRQHISQSYLSFKPQVRLRCIDHGAHHFITIKTDADPQAGSLVRQEFEAEITAASYAELIPQRQGKTLVKTRYRVPDGFGHLFEIDIYEGEFEGLVVAEMEFASQEEAESYPMPPWALNDVSDDPFYLNVVMAQR